MIQAGIDILADRGLSGLILRACAAQAGASHTAHAHHFQGLPGLLTAIAARGLQVFSDTMIDHRTRAGDTASARLVAICNGYLAFAEAHPDLFTLMFNARIDFVDDPGFCAAAEAAFAVLADACAPF